MAQEREVAGVVAHGLLNTLAVISGSACTLAQYFDRLAHHDRELLLTAIVSSGELFNDGLDLIVDDCSVEFGDAATTLALSTRSLRSLAEPDLLVVLAAIVDRSAVLVTGLHAMVRGLPEEVVSSLDALRR